MLTGSWEYAEVDQIVRSIAAVTLFLAPLARGFRSAITILGDRGDGTPRLFEMDDFSHLHKVPDL